MCVALAYHERPNEIKFLALLLLCLSVGRLRKKTNVSCCCFDKNLAKSAAAAHMLQIRRSLSFSFNFIAVDCTRQLLSWGMRSMFTATFFPAAITLRRQQDVMLRMNFSVLLCLFHQFTSPPHTQFSINFSYFNFNINIYCLYYMVLCLHCLNNYDQLKLHI